MAQDVVDFPDSSMYARGVSGPGAVFIDRKDDALRGAAAYFGGSGGAYLTTPSVTGFNLGVLDWSVDCFFECDGTSGQEVHICGQTNTALTFSDSSFRLYKSDADLMVLEVSDATAFITVSSISEISFGRHHVLVCRVSNVLRMFIDGLKQGPDVPITGSTPIVPLPFNIGARGNNIASNAWIGWIDEFRFMEIGRASCR